MSASHLDPVDKAAGRAQGELEHRRRERLGDAAATTRGGYQQGWSAVHERSVACCAG